MPGVRESVLTGKVKLYYKIIGLYMNFIDQEKFKNNTGIYIIKNIVNNKVYVGQTFQNFQRRYWHHYWKLKDNTHDNKYLQASWNKYGEKNFIFQVIEVVDDVNIIENREIFWINYYLKNNLSYNMALGGGGKRGVPMSEDAKKIVGAKNRAHNLGKVASDETKRKMSEIRTGKRVYRYNDKLDDSQVIIIKNKLIRGEKPAEISKELNIPYKVINNIYSGNSYRTVHVEGWDDFYNNRPRQKRSPNFTQEEIDEIIYFHKKGLSNAEIGRMFNTHRTRIRQCILNHNNK